MWAINENHYWIEIHINQPLAETYRRQTGYNPDEDVTDQNKGEEEYEQLDKPEEDNILFTAGKDEGPHGYNPLSPDKNEEQKELMVKTNWWPD